MSTRACLDICRRHAAVSSKRNIHARAIHASVNLRIALSIVSSTHRFGAFVRPARYRPPSGLSLSCCSSGSRHRPACARANRDASRDAARRFSSPRRMFVSACSGAHRSRGFLHAREGAATHPERCSKPSKLGPRRYTRYAWRDASITRPSWVRRTRIPPSLRSSMECGPIQCEDETIRAAIGSNHQNLLCWPPNSTRGRGSSPPSSSEARAVPSMPQVNRPL